jgi:hypothetical protein
MPKENTRLHIYLNTESIWDMTWCTPLKVTEYFGGILRLHLLATS